MAFPLKPAKNCSNDDIFISCDDRIGKMLLNICMSAVALSLRWANRGPWASCYTSYLSTSNSCPKNDNYWIIFIIFSVGNLQLKHKYLQYF